VKVGLQCRKKTPIARYFDSPTLRITPHHSRTAPTETINSTIEFNVTMADEPPAPAHEAPQTRNIHCCAWFPKLLIQDLVPTSIINRITLIVDDATGKTLSAEARLLDDYASHKIIIDDPWILRAFNVRTNYAGYVRFPPAMKLQLESLGEDDLDDDAPHRDNARLVDITKVPASEAYARRHMEDLNDR
jgi:hypothetical protein